MRVVICDEQNNSIEAPLISICITIPPAHDLLTGDHLCQCLEAVLRLIYTYGCPSTTELVLKVGRRAFMNGERGRGRRVGKRRQG